MSNSRSKKLEFAGNLLSLITAGAALIAGVYTVLAYHSSSVYMERAKQSTEIVETVLNREEREELDVLRRKMDSLSNALEALSKLPEESKSAIQYTALEESVRRIEARLSNIEGIIIKDAATALEIPMLKNELENSREVFDTSMDALRQDLSQAYTLITSTIVALAVAVLAPALINTFKVSREDSPGKNGERDSSLILLSREK